MIDGCRHISRSLEIPCTRFQCSMCRMVRNTSQSDDAGTFDTIPDNKQREQLWPVIAFFMSFRDI